MDACINNNVYIMKEIINKYGKKINIKYLNIYDTNKMYIFSSDELHLEIIKFIEEMIIEDPIKYKTIEIDETEVLNAAQEGHFKTIDYLIEKIQRENN